jgi:hypothetical protein
MKEMMKISMPIKTSIGSDEDDLNDRIDIKELNGKI